MSAFEPYPMLQVDELIDRCGRHCSFQQHLQVRMKHLYDVFHRIQSARLVIIAKRSSIWIMRSVMFVHYHLLRVSWSCPWDWSAGITKSSQTFLDTPQFSALWLDNFNTFSSQLVVHLSHLIQMCKVPLVLQANVLSLSWCTMGPGLWPIHKGSHPTRLILMHRVYVTLV